jgi:hypothetical protein
VATHIGWSRIRDMCCMAAKAGVPKPPSRHRHHHKQPSVLALLPPESHRSLPGHSHILMTNDSAGMTAGQIVTHPQDIRKNFQNPIATLDQQTRFCNKILRKKRPTEASPKQARGFLQDTCRRTARFLLSRLESLPMAGGPAFAPSHPRQP